MKFIGIELINMLLILESTASSSVYPTKNPTPPPIKWALKQTIILCDLAVMTDIGDKIPAWSKCSNGALPGLQTACSDSTSYFGSYVTCVSGIVTGLSLKGEKIAGNIPDSLGSLSTLTSLEITSNTYLSGSIPDSLGNLKALRYLSLASNALTASIPATLTSLTSLSYLDVSRNFLTGNIPIGLCRQLLTLKAGGNQDKNIACPAMLPTRIPFSPTKSPTSLPNNTPLIVSASKPTARPTVNPLRNPSRIPMTYNPSATPISTTNSKISMSPTHAPTYAPTFGPSKRSTPTYRPSSIPSTKPVPYPTLRPTSRPTHKPTPYQPSYLPTATPSKNPTFKPTATPTRLPTPKPTLMPTIHLTVAPTSPDTSSFIIYVGGVQTNVFSLVTTGGQKDLNTNKYVQKVYKITLMMDCWVYCFRIPIGNSLTDVLIPNDSYLHSKQWNSGMDAVQCDRLPPYECYGLGHLDTTSWTINSDKSLTVRYINGDPFMQLIRNSIVTFHCASSAKVPVYSENPICTYNADFYGPEFCLF